MTPEAALAQLMGRPLVADPFPLYAELRTSSPVHREPNGVWYLVRHRDCESLLRSPRFGHHGHHGAAEPAEGSDRQALLARMFSFDDPPVHTRKRAVFSAPFTVASCEAYIPTIEALAEKILDAIEPSVAELAVDVIASQLPVMVTCNLLGIPAADHARCVGWVEAMTSVNQPVPIHELEHNANVAARAAVEYFTALLAERARHPEDDLLSHVARTAARDASLADEDIVANIVMLMAAGFETTRYTIAGRRQGAPRTARPIRHCP